MWRTYGCACRVRSLTFSVAGKGSILEQVPTLRLKHFRVLREPKNFDGRKLGDCS